MRDCKFNNCKQVLNSGLFLCFFANSSMWFDFAFLELAFPSSTFKSIHSSCGIVQTIVSGRYLLPLSVQFMVYFSSKPFIFFTPKKQKLLHIHVQISLFFQFILTFKIMTPILNATLRTVLRSRIMRQEGSFHLLPHFMLCARNQLTAEWTKKRQPENFLV